MTADSIHRHQQALKEKHSILEEEIRDEESRPHPDSETLYVLKVKKLHLKEDIEHFQ